MKKFTSIITVTFPSNPAYDEWTKIQNKFFFEDKRVVTYLKENGMTSWTLTKTDDVEPIKKTIAKTIPKVLFVLSFFIFVIFYLSETFRNM